MNVPKIHNIDAAILKAIEAGGRLDMERWHGNSRNHCGTTHCRAGWAIALAGEAGWELEQEVGPEEAGRLIYEASRPGQEVPDFFSYDDHRVLEDIRANAHVQTEREIKAAVDACDAMLQEAQQVKLDFEGGTEVRVEPELIVA